MRQRPNQPNDPRAGLAGALRPHGRRLALVLVALGALGALNLLPPLLVKEFVERSPAGTGADAGGALLAVALTLAAVHVLRNASFFIGRRLTVGMAERLCAELRTAGFRRLVGASEAGAPSVEASAALMEHSQQIRLFVQDRLPTFLLNAMTLPVVLGALFSINAGLACVCAASLPAQWVAFSAFRSALRTTHGDATSRQSALLGAIADRVGAAEAIADCGSLEWEAHELEAMLEQAAASAAGAQRATTSQKVAGDLIVSGCMTAVIVLGAHALAEQSLTTAGFFVFIGYAAMLFPTCLEVLGGLSHWTRAAVSYERIREPHASEDRREDASPGAPGAGAPPEIRCEGVHFAHAPERPVFDDLSLHVKAAEHVAIMAPGGGGATTLLRLLSGRLAPSGGRVTVAGLDPSRIPAAHRRRIIALAHQEPALLAVGITENVLRGVGDGSADPRDLRWACEVAEVWPLIERSPGPASTLSRSERQRVALARTLVRRPLALLLDEALEALDDECALRILAAIRRELPRCTIVHCTHRLALASQADRTIHLATRDSPAGSARRGVGGPTAAPVAPFTSGVVALALAAAAVFGSPGCVSVSRTDHRSFELSAPREGPLIGPPAAPAEGPTSTTAGDPVAAASAEVERPGAGVSVRPLERPRVRLAAFESPAGLKLASWEPSWAEPPAPATPPRGSGAIVRLSDLSPVEVSDLVRSAILSLVTERSYAVADERDAALLAPAPRSMSSGTTLVARAGGLTRLLRIAEARFTTGPAELHISGVELGERDVQPNPDVAAVLEFIDERLGARPPGASEVRLADLASEVFQLSYIDTATAMAALGGLGVTTLAAGEAGASTIGAGRLPLVSAMPGPGGGATTLVGAQQEPARSSQGLTMIPNVASPLANETVAGPIGRLVIHYAPSAPEQLARVLGLLNDLIDVPARQVLIEGMVLEISEEGLRDLGIEWELRDGALRAVFGAAFAGLSAQTLDVTARKTADLASELAVRLRALIREGKAEILSRPSVLTLDNRQATIRVGEDIPVATSQEGTAANANKIAFDFRYIPTGILLNVRPRIDASEQQISLQIDTTVSAVVPGADLEVRDSEGALLASAPTIASRKVQTYARIANNTPFIIGGLVSRNETTVVDRVPLLSDIPLIGHAFRSERRETLKREVIIVLTPYVLSDTSRASRVKPQSSDAFGDTGRRLFRDSHRLSSGEVFDAGFLRRDPRVLRARSLVDEVGARDPRLLAERPFSHFAGDRAPGEALLVARMLYDVVKRLQLGPEIDLARCIVLSADDGEVFDVAFIDAVLARASVLQGDARFAPGRALAVIFTEPAQTGPDVPGAGLRAGLPELRPMTIESREHWRRALWDLNQPTVDGRRRSAALLSDASDLDRLRHAIVLKDCIELNGGWPGMALSNFQIGSQILVPQIEPGEIRVIDAATARLFFISEHYYGALDESVRRALGEVEAASRALGVAAPRQAPEAP